MTYLPSKQEAPSKPVAVASGTIETAETPHGGEYVDILRARAAELEPEATIRKFRIVRREGEREVARLLEYCSLDAILAVGYRVR